MANPAVALAKGQQNQVPKPVAYVLFEFLPLEHREGIKVLKKDCCNSSMPETIEVWK